MPRACSGEQALVSRLQGLHHAGMYLRRNRPFRHGELYDYWTLVRTVRTARGPRQQIVAHLGKLDEKEQREVRGWAGVDVLFSHYRNLVKKSEAIDYWNIIPDDKTKGGQPPKVS